MDKSWIEKRRNSPEYEAGMIEFLDFAFAHSSFGDKILCPCVRCRNAIVKDRENVHGDLLWFGIMTTYTNWTYHGEDIYREENISDEFDENDDIQGMLEDAFGMPNLDRGEDNESNERGPDEPNGEARKFYGMLEDAEIEIYPGLERRGRVHGFGLGPTPSSVFGPSSSQCGSFGTYSQVCTQLDNVMDRVKEMEEREAKLREEMEERETRIRAETQEQMQLFMAQFQQNMVSPHQPPPSI